MSRKQSAARSHHSAFTLIELSIVLVIIGLIIGGVMAGQELMKSGQIRKIISEKDAIDTAVNTFRTKYNSLPGDMTNATSYWGSAGAGCSNPGYVLVNGGATCNGNGDGYITDSDLQPHEAQWFWHHLFNAGLLNLPYPTQLGMNLDLTTPISANDAVVPGQSIPLSNTGLGAWEAVYWNNAIITQTNGSCSSSLSFFQGTCWVDSKNVLEFVGSTPGIWGQGGAEPALTPNMTYNIDTKIDDGLPDQGSVRAGVATGILCTTTNGLGVISYNISNNTPQCAFAYLTNW